MVMRSDGADAVATADLQRPSGWLTSAVPLMQLLHPLTPLSRMVVYFMQFTQALTCRPC